MNNEKKSYTEPEVEIMHFETEDVITTSANIGPDGLPIFTGLEN